MYVCILEQFDLGQAVDLVTRRLDKALDWLVADDPVQHDGRVVEEWGDDRLVRRYRKVTDVLVSIDLLGIEPTNRWRKWEKHGRWEVEGGWLLAKRDERSGDAAGCDAMGRAIEGAMARARTSAAGDRAGHGHG